MAEVNSEFSKEQTRAVFREHATYLGKKLKKVTLHQERIRRVREEWKNIRSDTIRLIDTAIRCLSDDSADVTEIVSKIFSALGKCLMFGGPLGVVGGAAISITGDVVNAVSCASRESQKSQYLDAINRVLESDTKKAEELCHLIQMTRMLSEDIKDCIKHFHAATVHGFYNSLLDFKKFVESVCEIADINNPESVYKFLRAVGIASVEFRKELSLPLSNLLQPHHRGVLWCAVSVLEIAVTSGIAISVGVAGAEIGLSACGTTLGRVLPGMNVFSIFCDVANITDKALQHGKKSPIVKQLEVVKRKLLDENKTIDKGIQDFFDNEN